MSDIFPVLKCVLMDRLLDYVRPYTWDKKVENFVKETGFLNGVGEGGPAVMHPRAYRERFLGAMDRYFPMVGLSRLNQNIC